MRRNFYSQNGEDYLLYKLFDSKKNGFFIDIGAFDGIHLSNSYFLEKTGWEGICIEANPKYFDLCKKNRRNSICLNVACVGDPDSVSVKFYTEELGLLSGIRPHDDVKSRYERRGLIFKGFSEVQIEAMTLNNILEKYLYNRKIDFISIDVEGTEYDVLKGFDIKRYTPKIIVIEVQENERDNIDNHLLNENKYHLGRKIQKNIFYLRDIKDLSIIKDIKIDCKIKKTNHPLGKAYTIFGKPFNENIVKKNFGERLRKWMLRIINSE